MAQALVLAIQLKSVRIQNFSFGVRTAELVAAHASGHSVLVCGAVTILGELRDSLDLTV